MYKQYPFQYSAPKTPGNTTTDNNTTANNNTKTPANNTTDNNTTDKTPVEVTADEVINAVKYWVKERDLLKADKNAAQNIEKQSVEDLHINYKHGTKQTVNQQKKVVDPTNATNYNGVTDVFTNKKIYYLDKSVNFATSMKEAITKQMMNAYGTLFIYFLEKKSTDEIFEKLFEKQYDRYITRETAFVVLGYLHKKEKINDYIQTHIPHICLFLSDPGFRFNLGSGNVVEPMKTDKQKKQALEQLLNKNNPSVEDKMKNAILTIYYLDYLMDESYYTKNSTKYKLRVNLRRELMLLFNNCFDILKGRQG